MKAFPELIMKRMTSCPWISFMVVMMGGVPVEGIGGELKAGGGTGGKMLW